jgi:membrane protease YdiL (CAAX protease family)
MKDATRSVPPTQAPEVRRIPLVRRRPVTAFLIAAFGIGWSLLAVPLVASLPTDLFLLALVFVALLAPALLVTRAAGGPGAVRRFLSRALVWRFGVGRWALILLGMPALTVGLAAATGTLSAPDDGWAVVVARYLFTTLIFGALILNIWEEAAWGGFAQSRLMARHGLLVGSLLTAPLFAGIHLPLLFADDPSTSSVLIGAALLFGAAPFYRYLLGMHLLDTGGSILAIGVQHAAWNAAGNLAPVSGDWQVVVAAVLLTLGVAAARRLWHPTSQPSGRDAEMAAATRWAD